jgi:hypothetical protein
MANPILATTLSSFTANVHKTKNRLIAIPAAEQRRLGLQRRANNHIVSYSIRRRGQGRWNHHLAYLTYDNEFAIPADVTAINGGDTVEVKIHQVIANANALVAQTAGNNPGALLSGLAAQAGDDDREDGSQNVDDYLYGNHHHG